MSEYPLSPGDHFFEANGIRFHYLVRGKGPLAVLQSVGWGLAADYMVQSFAPMLEESNTLLFLEPRGNGLSSKPADEATMSAKQMVVDLEALRQHIGLEQFPILMGASHAAVIAMRYAELYPTRVAKLVLLSAQVMDGPANNKPGPSHVQEWIAKRKNNPAYTGAIAALTSLFSGNQPQTDEQFAALLGELAPWYFSDPALAHNLTDGLSGSLPSIWAFQTNVNDMKEENKIPQVAEADKITAKTLIIRGDEDAMCSGIGAQAVADGIKGSKYVEIPGVGHLPHYEKPDEFWPVLQEFLKE